MNDPVLYKAPINLVDLKAARLGFWAALLLAIVTLVSFSFAVTTLPITGPFCQQNCIVYPYRDAAAYVPHDFIWMIPALFIAPLFLIVIICIHQTRSEENKLYSLIALCFALIYTTLLSFNYLMQIEVVQASLVRGEAEAILSISQYNPHSLFITLEDTGYLLMGLAFFFAALSLTGKNGLEKSIHWLWLTVGLLVFILYPIYWLIYGYNLEYRYEVAVITLTWMTSLVAGVLLSIYFKRLEKSIQKKSLPRMSDPKRV